LKDDVTHKSPYEVAGEFLWIPLTHIWANEAFNCRGGIRPTEVYELGQSINQEGQKMPLLVQPIGDVPHDEQPDVPGWDFRLIAGFRRYMAVDVWTSLKKVKCIVEFGLTKQQAHALNFTENLQREDLNMLQEAISLERTWAGENIIDVARYIGKPKRWVKSRFDLLELPEYVQRKAALPAKQGGLSQYDIEELAALPPSRVEPAFQKIVTRGRRDKPTQIRGNQRWKNRPRGKKQLHTTLGLLMKARLLTPINDDCMKCVASTIAWMTKDIDSVEFFEKRLGFPEGSCIINETGHLVGFQDEDGNILEFR